MTDTPRSNAISPVVFMGSGGPDLTSPELKPCPFCGCNLEVLGSPITRDIKKVQHPSNDCLLSGHMWWYVPRFIEPWNTRADLCAPAPRVKALEWRSIGRDRVAETRIGEYVVSLDVFQVGGTAYLWVAGQAYGDEHHSEHENMHAAKAAAQADFERRILAALEPPQDSALTQEGE